MADDQAEQAEQTREGEAPQEKDERKGSILTDNFVARFLKGFWYPFRGLRFVFGHLSLVKFCALPILINIILFVLIFSLSNYFWADFVRFSVTGPCSGSRFWAQGLSRFSLWSRRPEPLCPWVCSWV